MLRFHKEQSSLFSFNSETYTFFEISCKWQYDKVFLVSFFLSLKEPSERKKETKNTLSYCHLHDISKNVYVSELNENKERWEK